MRWVPNTRYRHLNSWDPQTNTLGYYVPLRSQHLLESVLEDCRRDATVVDVLLLVGGRRYDMGSFVVQSYTAPTLFLVRCGGDLPDSSPAARPAAAAALPTAVITPRLPRVDSLLEQQYHHLFAIWGFESCAHHTMYEVGDDTQQTVSWYTPDGILYDALDTATENWCGGPDNANRHGAHCLLEIKPVFPAQDVFAKLRVLTQRFSIPVLLVYGRPDVVPTAPHMDYTNLIYATGTQAMLFRPADGHTRRVHFNHMDGRVRVVLGEVGEWEALHASVIAGHESIRTDPLMQKRQRSSASD